MSFGLRLVLGFFQEVQVGAAESTENEDELLDAESNDYDSHEDSEENVQDGLSHSYETHDNTDIPNATEDDDSSDQEVEAEESSESDNSHDSNDESSDDPDEEEYLHYVRWTIAQLSMWYSN